MQKWEFSLVIAELDFWKRNTPVLSVSSVNGDPPKEFLPMHELANNLGEQGWELVNMERTKAPRGDSLVIWLFKRLRP